MLKRQIAPFLLLALSLGCAVSLNDSDNTSLRRGRRDVGTLTRSSGSSPDRYFAVQGKKKNKAGRMALAIPCDLWGPFRMEVQGGIYESKFVAKADKAIFGTELDARGTLFPPTEFYGISAQVISGVDRGLSAFAFTHNSSSPIGSHFFAGATILDLAIDYDGTTLKFLARVPGAASFTTVATFPLNQTKPLLPTVGVFQLKNKARVGFDQFRVVSNGTSPNVLTPAQEASRLIWVAVFPQVEGLHLLDGANPDFATAQTQLTDAQTKFTAAFLAVKGLTKSKSQKKALSVLKKAKRELAEALAQVNKQKKAGKVIKALEKALDREILASQKIYPVQ